MHKFEMPIDYIERVTHLQGRSHTCETFDTVKTALVVVDMQNYFMHESQQAACAMGAKIVPNVNRIADTVRKTGGLVVWVQNFAPHHSRESWSAMRERFTPENQETRWGSMQKDAFGFELWPELDVHAEDARVVKRRYSAFIQGSSDIEIVLKDNGIETVLIAGIATNVCCEASARDAMMLNFRTAMVSDACATFSDREHAASLGNFYLNFGDVQLTDEIIARLEASDRRNTADAVNAAD